ncbi:hypothetical protein [Acinetobacter towneri]|uniref:hypothetical protein n=1 Tax=Acinetobacter towneri TaxID=202956 RepID=UPI00336BFCB5
MMSTYDSEMEIFLKNGGKITSIPPSNNPPKAKKIRKFTRTEMEQIINFVQINGASTTGDVARYLDVPYSKCKCILAYAEEMGKLVSNKQNDVLYWVGV